jgi:hemin uptake protein HemP
MKNKNASPKNPPAASVSSTRTSSETLFGEHNQLVIVHNGQDYLLRITSANKLILNK